MKRAIIIGQFIVCGLIGYAFGRHDGVQSMSPPESFVNVFGDTVMVADVNAMQMNR